MMINSIRYRWVIGLCCMSLIHGSAAMLIAPALAHELSARPLQNTTTQVVTLARDIHLTLEMRNFDPLDHVLTTCEHTWVCLIDGYPVFGAEGAVPSIQVTGIRLNFGNQEIELEHKGMYNPWPPSDGAPHIRIVDESANGLRIRGEFSDGSAGYIVEWLVISGGSARVLIDCVECTSETSRSMDKWLD
jgi:hypothetical protein